MKRRVPLLLLGFLVWLVAFGALSVFWLYWSVRHDLQGRIDWRGLGVMALGPTGLILMVVQHMRERPSAEQRAALAAIFAAGPDTRGAVLVTRQGKPQVIATVRSREEYLELLGSGQLPEEHSVYLPDEA